MSRTPHAFAAAENRIDRGKTKERKAAQAEHFAKVAASTADGVLGGYSAEIRPDLSRAVIREFSARLKAAEDAPALASFLGEVANTLCADIKGGRSSAREAANRLFSGDPE